MHLLLVINIGWLAAALQHLNLVHRSGNQAPPLSTVVPPQCSIIPLLNELFQYPLPIALLPDSMANWGILYPSQKVQQA